MITDIGSERVADGVGLSLKYSNPAKECDNLVLKTENNQSCIKIQFYSQVWEAGDLPVVRLCRKLFSNSWSTLSPFEREISGVPENVFRLFLNDIWSCVSCCRQARILVFHSFLFEPPSFAHTVKKPCLRFAWDLLEMSSARDCSQLKWHSCSDRTHTHIHTHNTLPRASFNSGRGTDLTANANFASLPFSFSKQHLNTIYFPSRLRGEKYFRMDFDLAWRGSSWTEMGLCSGISSVANPDN